MAGRKAGWGQGLSLQSSYCVPLTSANLVRLGCISSSEWMRKLRPGESEALTWLRVGDPDFEPEGQSSQSLCSGMTACWGAGESRPE